MRWVLAIALCAALTALALYVCLWRSPATDDAERTARMLFVHVPAAANALLAFTVAAAASLIYLLRKRTAADRWARAAMAAGLVLGTVMLASGMAWARMAWGHWWDFKSPKLVLALVLWILMIVYFVLRSSLPAGLRRMKVAAAYCLIAYVDVPLVYLSTRLATSDIHTTSVSALDARPPDLAWGLAASFAALTALHALLLAALLRRLRKADLASPQA